MATKRLEERFAFTGGTVDRAGKYPVVRGVLLCGPTSANRRRYLKQAFAGDRVRRYEGKPVFVDHGDGRTARSYRDKIGVIENARVREADGMPVGDIAVNPEQACGKQFLWDAEHKPNSCGMSHVAHCETKPAADGYDEVTEVAEVESVDVVIGPATTKGLHEQAGRDTVFTLKRLAEWVARHPKSTTKQITRAKKLAEDYADVGDVPAAAEDPAADADPDAAISAGFKAAIMAVVAKAMDGGMDAKAALAKIKTLLNSHGDATDSGSGSSGDGEGDGTPAEEGRKRKAPTVGELVTEAKGFGFKTVTGDDLAILADLPTADARKRYCESVLARAGEPPTSGSRQPGSGYTPPAGGGSGTGTGTQKTEEQKKPITWQD